jgi:hypothetical protein
MGVPGNGAVTGAIERTLLRYFGISTIEFHFAERVQL